MPRLFQCKNPLCAYAEYLDNYLDPDCTRHCPHCRTPTMRQTDPLDALQAMKACSNEIKRIHNVDKLLEED